MKHCANQTDFKWATQWKINTQATVKQKRAGTFRLIGDQLAFNLKKVIGYKDGHFLFIRVIID